jgi:hypothetical protein
MSLSLLSQELVRVFLLSIPLIVGGIVHMIAVKANTLSYLKKPVHPRWFGLNKTWRGFVIMPLATWPGVLLAQSCESLFDLKAPLLANHSSIVLALLLGLGYCLAELPNSFVKRRLGIQEGQTSEKYKWFFVTLDQADSVIGSLLAYKLILTISWTTFLVTIVFGTVLHLMINVLLYLARIRKNPF